MKAGLPAELWLELHNRELDDIKKSLDGERKNRGKREFILVIICLLALLYTYPIQNFQTNPNIEIPAISLHLPLRDALALFPTLIAAIYLVYLASAISESILMARQGTYLWQLREFKKSGEIPPEAPERGQYFSSLRYLLLPTPLHRRGFHFGAAAAIPRAIVDGFVGFVFTLLPYMTTGFIVIKSWRLLHYKTILFWNSICLLIMVLAFASAALGSRQTR